MHRALALLTEDGRLAEWATSFVLAGIAAALLTSGDGAAASVVHAFPLGQTEIGIILALTAAGRLVALTVNGRWHASPGFRALGAACGAATFAALSILYAWPALSGDAQTISTAAPTYAALAVIDVVSAWRAGADARRSRFAGR